MSSHHPLFEVSFEVCNKVGGIHTVLSSKAPTLVERLGDRYVCVGPWLLRDDEHAPRPFEREDGHEAFEASCRALGLPVQVGRWAVPGRPRTILVEFSGLYEQKDDILAELWEKYSVDSIQGDWDYVEPVLFGHAAGLVIEAWWEEHLAPQRRRAIAQFHEWMTGAGLLHLKRRCPGIGTVFTTHATMLGRALSSLGRSPEDGLGDDTAAELAVEHGVPAKHSLEGTCAREADVFTTVSEITAAEAALLHERTPDPVLPNGIDTAVVDALAGEPDRGAVRARLARFAGAFLGEDVSDAAFVAISGRYEHRNKGFDLLLDACADLAEVEGRRLVVFALVPAGNSGLRAEVRERLDAAPEQVDGPLGVSTHNLFEPADDPILSQCAALGLDNGRGGRVKVVMVPTYLSEHDDFLQLPYEAVARAMDLTCFPSFYEPWGYTPQESLALGVPTITTDCAGFGRWANAEDLGPAEGITVLTRTRRDYADVRADLTAALERFLREASPSAETCRDAARRTSWVGFVENYERAFAAADEAIQARLERGTPLIRRPRRKVAATGEGRAPRLTRFDVSALLPPELEPLQRVARNYAWCWDPEGQGLFAELSPESWASARRNPVPFLRDVFARDVEEKARDEAYVAKVARVAARLDAYLAEEPTTEPGSPISRERPVAYFSAEFGVHESLRIYSGGLGILAGDHLKSASDVGLPLVGVGLFYTKGYLAQRISAEGDQHGADIENDPRDLAVELVTGDDGAPLVVRLPMPGRELLLRAWRVDVGRVPLYLLDSNVEGNQEEDREITWSLYGGDDTMRIRQEIVLGRGGVRLLRALGLAPAAWHMNEGHAAFLGLERMARLVREEGLTFEEAREQVRATTAFTTHTPVPAGHDRFSEDLMRTYFSDVADWLGVPWERFLDLGRATPEGDEFNMTSLAIQFAAHVGGVSSLHRRVSRRLLASTWPGLLEDEVPIGSVTNGVHLPTWVRPSVAALVGAEDRPVRGADFEARADAIELDDLWVARREARAELLAMIEANLRRGFVERSDDPALLTRMLDGLDGDALWIGFARRFAPYKRAHLAFSDPERLRAILDDPRRPVRIAIAGKAHPRDVRGQEILRDVARIARSDEFAGRVILLEDYDVELARALVQGVDVWLNTPTRPLEASGTSGMKSAANGGLNLSIADGWWPEGADGRNGWTIGVERTYEDQTRQDQLDAETLYRLLEQEVVPLFFERDADGTPRGWLERARHALATLPHVFDTDRMVREYAATAYHPRAVEGDALGADRFAGARERARLKGRLRALFPKVRVADARVSDLAGLRVDDVVEARVELELGELVPEGVCVELVLGHARDDGDLFEPRIVALGRVEGAAEGRVAYEGQCRVERSGAYAYGLRLRAHPDVGDPCDVLRDLVRWLG